MMQLEVDVSLDEFDEVTYLEVYPDVAEAVKKGDLSSGLEHYLHYGQAEGRIANYSELLEQLTSQIHSLRVENQKLDTACDVSNKEKSAALNELYLSWQEIERLKYINSNLSLSLDNVFGSASWSITKPFRVLRVSFLAKLYRTGIAILKQLVRFVWNVLPLSVSSRVIIKKHFLKWIPLEYNTEQHHHIPNVIKQDVSSSDVTNLVIPRIEFDQTKDRFVAYAQNKAVAPIVKLIAFYLPQFHPFPENDAWWGKGFTEWTNVGKSQPNYNGHYQPHHPIHLGYYDLRVPEVMQEQARLAKEYGLYGFSYYFYWFDGKILMDTPLEMLLKNPLVETKFCLTWANENWTRRWDGQESDILIAQNHSDADSLSFIRHLIKYFNDERYIRVDGKPVLIIYRASIIPNMASTARLWREEVKKHNIPDLYLVCAQSFGIKSPDEFGFDASVEFPPHTVQSTDIRSQVELTNPDYQGHIFSYDQVVDNEIRKEEPDYKLFRTAMLSWDNTARKQHNSHIFHGFSLLRYKQWLSSICNSVYRNPKYSDDEKFVFINAWNEWAEGTHLEPDRKFGYGYLQTTYDVIANYDADALGIIRQQHLIKRHNYAVMVHVHYDELWPVMRAHLNQMDAVGFDLYVTTTNQAIISVIKNDYPFAYIDIVENRGRDILPFVSMLKKVESLGYIAVCKLHTKRSAYRADGDDIRDELFDALVGTADTVQHICERFRTEASLGMIVPKKYLLPHTDHNMTFDHEVVDIACKILKMPFAYDVFPAGSMFWFRPEALRRLGYLRMTHFDTEQGLADGTLPHAIERLFCIVAKESGYDVDIC